MLNEELDVVTFSIFTLKENNFDFGLQDYKIFDEAYRPILNKAILDYYLLHEIGWSNPQIFKHYLNQRLDLIMRNKYNALYEAKAKEFNPLYTLDVYDEYSHTVNNSNSGEINSTNSNTNNTNGSTDTTNHSTSNSETSNDTLALASSYPSENMANNDLTSNVYLTGGQKNTATNNSEDTSQDTSNTEMSTTSTNNGTGTTTNTGNATTNETYSKHSYGSASDLSFAHAMTQFKDYVDKFDLDMQVIKELGDLFYNLYS